MLKTNLQSAISQYILSFYWFAVPLEITTYQEPEEYVCLGEEVNLTCVFRSWESPRNIEWVNTNGGVQQTISLKYELWKTTLYFFEATTVINSTCKAEQRHSTGLIPDEFKNHTFSIPLRGNCAVNHEGSFKKLLLNVFQQELFYKITKAIFAQNLRTIAASEWRK